MIAPFAFVVAPGVMMIAASAAAAALPDAPAVRGAMVGIQVAVVGILAANMLRMARSTAKGRVLTLVLCSGLVVGALSSAVLAVLAMGGVGALVALRRGDGDRHA